VETLTTWLDQVAGVQDFTNLRSERSLSSFDSRQQLTVGYALDLPLGKGQKFLPGVRGVADKIISSWGSMALRHSRRDSRWASRPHPT